MGTTMHKNLLAKLVPSILVLFAALGNLASGVPAPGTPALVVVLVDTSGSVNDSAS
jgi:hypothetical protein